MTKISFKTVGIICKDSIGKDVSRLEMVIKKMEKLGAKVLVDKRGGAALNIEKSYSQEEICKKSSLIISLGGDGTLLRTARSLDPKKSPPVLSVNIGRLGFLTEATLEDFDEKLKLIRAGKFKIDTRSMLAISLKRRGIESEKTETKSDTRTPHSCLLALNDVVINQGSFARLIKMSIKINDSEAALFKADGLIIASPTGSTGHSLSAGGPIVHPKVDGIVITPICPVLLSMRSIIIPDRRMIHIKIETERKEQQTKIGLTIDGQQTYDLDFEDEIEITRAPQQLNLIRTEGRNYYKTLNDKLGWGREK